MSVTVFAFAKQPWKALYLAYVLITVPLIRLPYWLVSAAIPPLRPIRSWDFTRTLVFRALKFAIYALYQVGFPPAGNPERDSKNPSESGFVWVDGVPPGLITGEIAEMAKANEVEPMRRYGYWYGARDEQGRHGQRARKGERVLMFSYGESHSALQ
jgi:hypothetical protein